MGEKWNIVYYQAPTQRSSPVYNFINSLGAKAKSKVINTIDLLEQFETKLSPIHSKKIKGTDLWELRILGQDNIRIFYAAVTSKTFLLLYGFQKKKQNIDQREIKTALDRLKEYRSRSS